MSRVSVSQTENGDYRVTATRGEYAVQVRYQPSDQARVPAADYVVCVDGTRNGLYGWHQIGRIGSDSVKALAEALRFGLLEDLRTIAPDQPPIDHDKQIAEAVEHSYTATFAHSERDVPGRMTLDATTEAEAIAEANAFVVQGMRGGTWINVSLPDGAYAARNEHGKAVGKVTRYSA